MATRQPPSKQREILPRQRVQQLLVVPDGVLGAFIGLLAHNLPIAKGMQEILIGAAPGIAIAAERQFANLHWRFFSESNPHVALSRLRREMARAKKDPNLSSEYVEEMKQHYITMHRLHIVAMISSIEDKQWKEAIRAKQ